MSHFYGKLFGSRKNPATSCGHKSTGIRALAKSWNLSVSVGMYWDKEAERNRVQINAQTEPNIAGYNVLLNMSEAEFLEHLENGGRLQFVYPD